MNVGWTVRCTACRADLYQIGEYDYMLLDAVWRAMVRRTQRQRKKASTLDYLCIGCVERRLGRPLVMADFNWSVPLTCRQIRKNSARLRRAKAAMVK